MVVNLEEKRTEKPWGFEKLVIATDHYVWNILCINKGGCVSLHYHTKQSKTLMVCGGKLKVALGGVSFVTDAYHDVIEIPPMTKYRLEALQNSVVFEVSTPELDDVVEIEEGGKVG